MTPQEAVLVAEKTGLQAVAITDHDTFSSAYEAYDFAQKEGLSVQVIPGMELSTNAGHLVVLGITSPILSGLSLTESLKLVHNQKAFAIAAHPFFKILRSIDMQDIAGVVNSPDPDVYFDGFEIHNTGVEDVHNRKPSFSDTNKKSQEFYINNGYKLGAAIGSSDSHGITVGRGLTAFHGNIFEAIKDCTTMAVSTDANDLNKMLEVAVGVFSLTSDTDDPRLTRLKNRINKS